MSNESIKEVKRHMPLPLSVLADKTPCFGVLWIDDFGECPEMECDLRLFCKQAFNLKSVASAKNTFVLSNSIAQTQKKPLRKHITNRGKWKDTDKFKRKGYTHLNRKVDVWLDVLKSAFEFDAVTGFSSVCSNLTIKATASYHTISYKRTPVVRFWNNTPRSALVDVAAELVAPINTIINNTRIASWNIKPTFGLITSKKQVTTFRDRTKIRTTEGVHILINAIKQVFP